MSRGSSRKLLLCVLGYVGVAGAEPTELEVLGQITVHTDVEPTADGEQIVTGRLSDEVGKPVAGEISVTNERGRSVDATACPWVESDPAQEADPKTSRGKVMVGPNGQFCFLTPATKGIVLQAGAEHFLTAKHDLDIGATRTLERPRFVQAPSTIDLHEPVAHVVEVLARSERKPPRGAQISLSIECEQSTVLKRVPLADIRLLREEFETPSKLTPGNCQFIAEASAPGEKPLKASRSVLVRDAIRLQVAQENDANDVVELVIQARGSGQSSQDIALREGLVEARENGAFVALAPVKNGLAHLDLERGSTEREFSLNYIPASAAYVAGKPLSYTSTPRTVGFRWASIHTVGLLLFAAWLGYAWLRPRHGEANRSHGAPPKRAVVREEGQKSGPISGKVLDAHTGIALPEIRLALCAVQTEAAPELEALVSDDKGEFQFSTKLEDHPMLKLRAEGDEYMSLQSTTRSAKVSVHLTHRRRAAIGQLVNWARRAGLPWSRPKPPTPGSVETTAESRGDESTAEWARSVGQAAYAPGAPSEETVEGLREPRAQPPQEAP